MEYSLWLLFSNPPVDSAGGAGGGGEGPTLSDRARMFSMIKDLRCERVWNGILQQSRKL